MPLQLKRRPKSPNWIMRGTVRGIRVEESTGTDNRQRAEEIKAKREAELFKQSVYGCRTVITFAEAALSYIEHGGRDKSGGERRFLPPVIKHFATRPLSQIDIELIEKGAVKAYPNASPSTRNRQFITPAVAVLTHAAERGWCQRLVIRRPKASPGIVRWLTLAEADALIAASSPHLAPLLDTLFFTGGRIGELLWLDWRFVDLARAHLSIPMSKNGESRGVPLHPRVVAALANLPHRKGEIFRKPDGKPYARPKGLDDRSAGTRIATAFKAACRRAGIENFRVHDCRHTWATWHYAANRDLGALQRLGGWKSTAMVLRYAHTNVDELAHTIRAIDGGKRGDDRQSKEKVS